jgi:peptidoglycan/LPS O-acetylase OafA/YrhL
MPRYRWLDVARGVLATSVVGLHAFWFNNVRGWFGDTQMAVNAFIVLSGFVITLLLVNGHESYRTFITRRLFRLMPVYLICLGLALALRPLVVGTAAVEASREASENAHYWSHLINHLAMTFGVVPDFVLPNSSAAILPPAWSISLELQLYLVAPLIVVLLAKRAGWGLWALSLCVLIPQINWRIYEWSEMGAFLPQKLYLFIGGALLFTYWPKFGNWSVPPSLTPLVWLGQISYPVYLVHYPLVALINAHLHVGAGPVARAFILLIISLPPVILASWLLHITIEKPFIRLGKQLSGKRNNLATGEVTTKMNLQDRVATDDRRASDIPPRTGNLPERVTHRN